MIEGNLGSDTSQKQPGSFSIFSNTCDKIRSTPSKLKKIEYLSEYFSKLGPDDLRVAASILSGRIFAPGEMEQDINVGYSLLWKAISELLGISAQELAAFYRRHGDLGSAIEEALQDRKMVDHQTVLLDHPKQELTIQSVHFAFRELAGTVGRESTDRKLQILKRLLLGVQNANEAKYLVKIVSGEMRIGLVQGLVEESISKAFGYPLEEIRTGNLVSGDIGLIAVLSKERKLSEAKLEPMRPTNFMLAETAENAEDLCSKFDAMPVLSEYKYDGIRAQVHCKNGQIRIFSRNLADVTVFFPEIESSFMFSEKRAIITDGEIVAFKDGHPESFQLLQRRLRKKAITENDVPVRYFVFDLLYNGGSSLIDQTLKERIEKLRSMTFGEHVSYSEQRLVYSAKEVAKMFDESKSLGYEGLVVKELSSAYSPGRRGSSWVKLKKELDTLDVVIVAAEFGHGKRAGVISDYTFAVKDGDDLKVVGKAYSGLTDNEIDEMTNLLKSITLQDSGFRRTVKPQVVLEVAFDAIQKSDRHDSGFALRFPRIKRLRPDKSPYEIDTLDKVKTIYENQKIKV